MFLARSFFFFFPLVLRTTKKKLADTQGFGIRKEKAVPLDLIYDYIMLQIPYNTEKPLATEKLLLGEKKFRLEHILVRVREREREQYFADTPDYLLIITANDLRGFFQRGRIYTKHEYPELHLFSRSYLSGSCFLSPLVAAISM